jgi:hypothetical protein
MQNSCSAQPQPQPQPHKNQIRSWGTESSPSSAERRLIAGTCEELRLRARKSSILGWLEWRKMCWGRDRGWGGAIKRWGEVSCSVACGKPPRKRTGRGHQPKVCLIAIALHWPLQVTLFRSQGLHGHQAMAVVSCPVPVSWSQKIRYTRKKLLQVTALATTNKTQGGDGSERELIWDQNLQTGNC